ncbi:hypothetical protein LTR85_009048 [Meristemomyces frigidus]|nr:hypothetical protein LTR85_009048 [Meristemomyces frigidus]
MPNRKTGQDYQQKRKTRIEEAKEQDRSSAWPRLKKGKSNIEEGAVCDDLAITPVKANDVESVPTKRSAGAPRSLTQLERQLFAHSGPPPKFPSTAVPRAAVPRSPLTLTSPSTGTPVAVSARDLLSNPRSEISRPARSSGPLIFLTWQTSKTTMDASDHAVDTASVRHSSVRVAYVDAHEKILQA